MYGQPEGPVPVLNPAALSAYLTRAAAALSSAWPVTAPWAAAAAHFNPAARPTYAAFAVPAFRSAWSVTAPRVAAGADVNPAAPSAYLTRAAAAFSLVWAASAPRVAAAADAPQATPSARETTDPSGTPAPGAAPASSPPASTTPPTQEPPPPDDDGWIPLDVPVDFGSAISGPPPEPDDTSAIGLPRVISGQTTRYRGRWSVRPWLGMIGLPGDAGGIGGTAGGLVSHQWGDLRTIPVRLAGETRLRAIAPFGQVAGWQLELDSAVGGWLGPVGLFAGPALRADRAAWRGGATLPAALLLGPQLRVAFDLGPVTPWIAATPAWILAGARDPTSAPWHEGRLEAGVVLDLRPVGFRLSGGAFHSAVGVGWDATLGLQLRLF
jgi:hypothetical protein